MTAGQVRAARGNLVRFVAVLAVLAGVMLAVGLQCGDGMTGAAPMGAAGVSMECGAPAMMGEPAGQQLNDPCTAIHAPDVSSPDGLGGVLATCLAFIVAVVAAIVWLRPARLQALVLTFRHVRAGVMRAVEPRAPSLAELCLLRT